MTTATQHEARNVSDSLKMAQTATRDALRAALQTQNAEFAEASSDIQVALRLIERNIAALEHQTGRTDAA